MSDPECLLFVTGRLAEPLVRRVVDETSADAGFTADVQVLGISVAALMHAEWVARKLTINGTYDRVILPGWCQGDLSMLSERFNVPFELGPKDIRDLPSRFGSLSAKPPDLSTYDIEILAEINHTPRLSDAEILRIARHYRSSGADVIDVGTIPGESWSRVGDVTRMLIDEGLRVSIDSFDRAEVESAVAAGAELVLSVNSSNIDWAADLDAELVVIPDDPRDLATLEGTIEMLSVRRTHGAWPVGLGGTRAEATHGKTAQIQHVRRLRIDPILEPIGFGFAASLARYFEARRRWPDVPMMMGIGNLTELTDVDTAGVNVLLAGLCQELAIGSVLTTEVIGWARSAVKEFDLARRLVRHAVVHHTLPKHVDPSLVMLRDPDVHEYGEATLTDMAARLTDPNFRIFVERGEIHVMNRDGYWRGSDPFELFDTFTAQTRSLDPSHAFYLGYELAKAVTALTLGKQYTQDQSLRWGFLTIPERSAHDRRKQPGSG